MWPVEFDRHSINLNQYDDMATLNLTCTTDQVGTEEQVSRQRLLRKGVLLTCSFSDLPLPCFSWFLSPKKQNKNLPYLISIICWLSFYCIFSFFGGFRNKLKFLSPIFEFNWREIKFVVIYWNPFVLFVNSKFWCVTIHKQQLGGVLHYNSNQMYIDILNI